MILTPAQASQVKGFKAGVRLRLAMALLTVPVALALALAVVLVHNCQQPAQAAIRRSALRRLETEAERAAGLPEGLLSALRMRYEKGHLGMVAKRSGGAAACGLYQIWVAYLSSPDGERLCSMARGPGAPGMAAQLLDESRRWCAGRSDCPCPWARYNWRDAARLCAALGGPET